MRTSKVQLLKIFERVPYFTMIGFRQILGDDDHAAQRARELLSRWGQNGDVIPLKRGVYMTRRFYELHRSDADFAPAVSAILNPLSYLSLEYILQRASILSEATYPITAVTRLNTRAYQNSLGVFTYQHLKPEIYTGFSQKRYSGILFYQASVAKALYDFFYLRPLPRNIRTMDIDLAEELRLNLDELSAELRDEFTSYIEASASEKMSYILRNLRRYGWLL
jgi:hypothetical protein